MFEAVFLHRTYTEIFAFDVQAADLSQLAHTDLSQSHLLVFDRCDLCNTQGKIVQEFHLVSM